MTEQTPHEQESAEQGDDHRVVIVTPQGMGIADARPSDAADGGGRSKDSEDENPADLVEQPAKVMRIGSMIKQLLDEVRNAPLDEAGRVRLAQIHQQSIAELKDGLAPELIEELDRIALPFTDAAPSDAELRVAQAQLVGWLEGLFHGIQTALVAQQMAAQAQLQQMRRALPPGQHGGMPGPHQGIPGQVMPGGLATHTPPDEGAHEGTGQYL